MANIKQMRFLHRSIAFVLSVVVLFTIWSVNATEVYAANYSTGTYVVNHSSGVNVRTSASTSSSIRGAAAKGISFTVSKVSGSWGYTSSIKTINGTKSGWISLNYCVKKTLNKPTVTVSYNSMGNLTTLTKGKGQHLSGTIVTTGSKISSINAKIVNRTSNKTALSKTVYPSSYSYKLYGSTLDYSMTFGSLGAGSYNLVYTVKAANGTTKTYTDTFTVKSSSTSNKTTTNNLTDYNNFQVVKGFKTSFCLDQNDYSKFIMNGRNQGCTAVSACIAISIKRGSLCNPKSYPWSSQGCSWNYCKGISSESSSKKLQQIAKLIQQGKAVALWANENHMVCVVGVRKGANLNSLKSSDLLIVDPYGGKITTLNKAQRGGYVYTKYKMYVAA